jgi:hypothetical protein
MFAMADIESARSRRSTDHGRQGKQLSQRLERAFRDIGSCKPQPVHDGSGTARRKRELGRALSQRDLGQVRD